MTWLDVDKDLMVNLDEVVGIEREGATTRLYVKGSNSIVVNLAYETIRSIVIQRKKSMQAMVNSGNFKPVP